MLKIGDFSRIAQVSVRTLQYYDRLGLFKPVKVDKFSGYRYYSMSQLSRLNRLLALRDMGLSLEQISQLLDANFSPEQLKAVLMVRQAEIKQQLVDGEEQLEKVSNLLTNLDENSPEYEVSLKEGETHTVAAIREKVDSNIKLFLRSQALQKQIARELEDNEIETDGGWLIIDHNLEYNNEDFDFALAVPIIEPSPTRLVTFEHIQIYSLAKFDTLACLTYKGLQNFRHAFISLGNWLESNDYQIAGATRLELLPESGTLPESLWAEIQLPVVKNSDEVNG
jgi:DNA-binding transcriptional MerR regulator